MNDTKKILWKANLLEFFHNYFIGISYLECTEEDCPIVDNWDNIEEKLSKTGLAALVKITRNDFLVTKIADFKINGLEELTEVTIEFRDGEQRLVRTSAEKEEILAKLRPWERNKIRFQKPEDVVYFTNNSNFGPNNDSNFGPNLLGAEDYLDNMWDIKAKITWDREKSKKKVFLFTENEPSDQAEATKIDASNKDYLFYIADPSITNNIKNYEVYSPSKGPEERTRLYQDLKEEFSELRRVFGIRHLTSKKEERQNNPEVELNESQFIALERRKKRIREKALKEAVEKGFCDGEHILTYGTAPEQRAEKVQEIKELQELEEPKKKGESD